MKRTVIFAVMMLAAVGCMAQYQLPNAGFEQWDGTSVTDEPSHWNSFATSDGSYASMASTPHHYHRSGGRPGTLGSSYLTVYTMSILGVKANGNMTTGRVHAGGLSASSSSNYNYTQRSNSAHCQPFTGTPDSMYVWVSFYAGSGSSQAQIAAILHGNNDFRSPNDESSSDLYCGKAVARFTRTTTSATTMQWQQMKVPFVYDGSASAAYMLINMTTNATAGGGAANDSLSIDDIEFVYSAWLGSITIDGEPVEGFDKAQMEYCVRVEDLEVEVNGVAEVSDAAVAFGRETVDDTTVLVTIDVIAEDNVTMRQYRVYLTVGQPPVSVDDLAVEAPGLAIYPNPADEMVVVDADGQLEISDMQGRVVMRRNVQGHTNIGLASLPAGVYIVRCGERAARLVRL